MKFLISILVGSLLSSVAWAAEDFDCRRSPMLKNSQLSCISCGIEDFYARKAPNRSVIPSDKWLVMLGIMVKQTSHLAPSRPDGRYTSRDNDIIVNDAARQAFQKKVIAEIQAYGACTNYMTKKNKGKKELSAADWKMLAPYLTSRKEATSKDLEDIAEFFGFANPWLGSRAEENIRYLTTGKKHNAADETEATRLPDFAEQPKAERRALFRKRLQEILGSEYDISGEKNSYSALASGNNANGLRECLQELKAMHDGVGDPLLSSIFQGQNSYAFCETMAKSCDLAANFCVGAAGPSVPKSPAVPHPVKIPPPPTPKPLAPLPPMGDDLPQPLNSGGQHGLDALPNPSQGVK